MTRLWATLSASAVGLAMVLAGVKMLAYGTTMFIALPFVVGFSAAFAESVRERRTFRQCFVAAILPLGALGALMLAFGIEGLICLAMAALPALVLATLGASLAYRLQPFPAAGMAHATAMLILMPLALFVGPHGPSHEMATATTSVIVNAPPALVWQYVTAFPELAPPENLLFRAGVAYPVVTHIKGEGVGAGRECVLSTGTMTERVTAWEPGHLLRFDVLYTPAAMKELSPWPDIHPPHLDGFYVSKQGEFRLTALPGGRTLVEGQSWYSQGLTPSTYWNLWAAYVVHGVHVRVLTHIKNLAEADAHTIRLARTDRPAGSRLLRRHCAQLPGPAL